MGWDFFSFVDVASIIKFSLPILLPLAVVIWQVDAQFKKNRALKLRETRDKIGLEVLREFQRQIRQTNSAATKASSHYRLLQTYLLAHKENKGWRIQDFLRMLDHDGFNTLPQEASNEAINIITLLERNAIIHHNLQVFQTAFCFSCDELRRAWQESLPNIMAAMGAAHNPDGRIFDQLMSEKNCEVIDASINKYLKATDHLTSYLTDLSVELQNELLGEIYQHRVPRRKPIDKEFQVLVLSPDEEANRLIHFFENETDWGKRLKEIDNSVRIELEAQGKAVETPKPQATK